MDPLSSISVVSGVAGALAGAGGVVSVLRKFVHLSKAERDLKVSLSPKSRRDLRIEFNRQDSRPSSGASTAGSESLRSKLDVLVQHSDMNENEREALLSELRQPSEVGKTRYAQKLYATVASGDNS
jgi:hypothetical protein